MTNGLRSALALLAAMTIMTIAATAAAAPNVTVNRYDRRGTGANLQETILNTSNVRASTFGRLFSYPVDGNIVAQPLWLQNVSIPNKGTHNVVFVATMKDRLYAFDADSDQGADHGRLWEVDFLARAGAGATTFPPWDATGMASEHLDNHLGIMSTPVIDTSTNTLYVVVNTKERSLKHTRLHALSVTTGQELSGSPVELAATFQAPGGPLLTFDTQIQMQRPGLALAGNNVIIATASHDDILPNYQGWVLSYDKTTLQRTAAFATVTTGGAYGGGIWMAGRAPVVDDSGFIYVFTGNSFGPNASNGSTNFSESVLKLNGALQVVDWFTPSNWQGLDAADADLASSGPMLIPSTNLLAGGGKEGILYILNTNSLGHLVSGDTQVVQKQRIVPQEHIMSGPVFWPRTAAAGGSLIFNSGESDVVKAWGFNGTTITTTPVASAPDFNQGHPGGMTVLSANGQSNTSGIVWDYVRAPAAQTPGHEPMPGILRAYNASNVSSRLWTSKDNLDRDDLGLFGKFCVPTVVNGKVYVGTNSNQLVVYGLLPTTPGLLVKAVPPRVAALGNTGTFLLRPFRLNGFSSSPINWTVSGLPAGASASFGTPAGDESVRMVITLGPSTPNGVSLLTVRAAAGTVQRFQTVLLEVDGSTPVGAGRSVRFVDSEEPLADNFARYVLDGNTVTTWITQWVNASPGHPHEIQLDLGNYYNVTGFSYLPRQDGCANGTIRKFEFYVSLDGTTWGPVKADGSYDYDTAPLDCAGTSPARFRDQKIRFREGKVGRYVRLVSYSEVNFNPWAAAAEIGVFASSPGPGVFPSNATQVHVIRGGDGTGWLKTYVTSWSQWDTISGSILGDPTAVAASANSWDIFARGSDTGIWTGLLANGTFSGWGPLGGNLTSRPAAIRRSTGQIDVLARGNDGAAWIISRVNNVWGAWTSLSGVIVGDPTLVQFPNGTEMAIVRGGDGGVWTNTRSGSTWPGWVSIGNTVVSQPTAVIHPDGKIDLFAIGSDSAAWVISGQNGAWTTSWSSRGPSLAGNFVTAVRESNGDVSIFGLGGNEHAIWTQRRSSATGQWTNWSLFGSNGSFTSPPTPRFSEAPRAVQDAEDQLQLTVTGEDGRIYQNRRLKGAWGIWVQSS